MEPGCTHLCYTLRQGWPYLSFPNGSIPGHARGGGLDAGLEQIFVLTDMRIVALEACSIAHLCVGFDCRQILLLVTFEAKLLAILDQELRLTGLVRVVAGGAFAHRRVLKLCFLQKIIVALEAEFCAGPGQQAFSRRGMWIMAGHTFA